MQNKLLYLAKYLTALLLFFVLHGFATELYSQILLDDNRTKDVQFSEQTDRERQSRIVVSLKNYSEILSSNLKIIENDWVSASEVQKSQAYLYSSNADASLSPGHIRIEGMDERVENAFSLKNTSSQHFGRLNISTDFVVRDSVKPGEISLVLMIKSADRQWFDAGRGVFFPKAESDEQSFSIQVSVSDVFMQKNEIIDLMWVNRSADTETHQLFTQRIEVTPEFSDTFPYKRGGLLITELLPMGDVDGYTFEYLELYNPDDVAKSLKGVTLETDYGVYTIQNDIEILPYEYYVLSNADFSDVKDVNNSLFYTDRRLFSDTEPNGRIEIKQNGELIASAVYEAADVNISFEADRMSQSVDGYTGLQNLKRSSNSFMTEVNGSPGFNGSSLPVYHKSFSESGMYLIAIPGRFYRNIGRIEGASFYSVEGNPLSLSEIEPFEPVFMVKNGSKKITLSVEGERAATNRSILAHDTDLHRYISPIKPGIFSVKELFSDRSVSMQPVVGRWDSSRNKVEIVNADQAVTELWKPVIVNKPNGEESQNSRSVTDIPFNAGNSFLFSLFKVQNDDENLLDEVWVEIDNENKLSSTDIEAPNFTKPLFHIPELQMDQKSMSSVLYASSPEIDKPGLSYFKLKTKMNAYSEFSLGTFNTRSVEQINGILEWNIPENIPEEWSIILTDRITGLETDMRVEDRYRFRLEAVPEKTKSDNSGQKFIQRVEINSEKKERFSVRIEPPNLETVGEEGTEIPDSIELRQNYPNPFNPSTNITFFLPEDRQVRLGIFNIVGQQVATLIDDNIGAGEHSVVWNASNNPSGIYIVQLETGSRILTRKITLVK